MILDWVVRVSGLVGYGALTLSMVFGILLSSRSGVHAPTLTELHRQWSWVGLGAALLHGGLMIEAFEEVWIGVLAFLGMAMLVGSFYIRGRLGVGMWRGIHALAFASFVGVVFHARSVGADMVNPIVASAVNAGFLVVIAGVVFRVAALLLPQPTNPTKNPLGPKKPNAT